MDPHHERLVRLVTEAREARGLTKQADFIRATGLGKTTVYRFERGERLSDTAYRSIDWAIGWKAGSCVAVLDGGEPSLAESASASPIPPERSERTVEPFVPLAERLPMSVRHQLENGEFYDADTYDLTPDGSMRILVIGIRDPDQPVNAEQLAREYEAWKRKRAELRRAEAAELEAAQTEPSDTGQPAK